MARLSFLYFESCYYWLYFTAFFYNFAIHICVCKPPVCIPRYSCLFSDGTKCKSDSFEFENISPKCDALYNQYIPSNNLAKGCEEKDLSVSLKHEPRELKGFYPHLVLNVTPTVYTPISHLFIRIYCLHVVKRPDAYCDKSLATSPCRSWLVTRPGVLQYPFSLSFSCFALTGLNSYMVTVSIAPQNCTSTFAVSSPVAADHPELASYFDVSHHNPFVIVDITPTDGVWLRYYRYQNGSEKNMINNYSVDFIVCLGEYEQNCPIVFERRITPPSTGIKWTNVPAGNYTAIAIVNEHDCLRSCNGCTVCANQSVKFFVQTDKYTVTHQALRTVKDFAKLFVFGLIATLFFITAIIFVYITVKKRIFGRKGLEERVLTLVSKPKVLIIYSYDCSQYSNCVCSLVHYLKQFANADVVFDQFELNTPGVVPVRWVLDAINRVDFVLTIFSEGAVELMKGNSLKRDLPFPELFITALHHIYAELSAFVSINGFVNQPHLNSRFIFAYFSFSPLSVVPIQIKSFPVHILCLPNQLGELILLLHHKSLRNDIVQGGDKSELDSVISAYEYFRLRNPSWLTERIAQGKDSQIDQASILSTSLQLKGMETSPLLTAGMDSEQKFSIEPPDEEINLKYKCEDGDNSSFPLVYDVDSTDVDGIEEDQL